MLASLSAAQRLLLLTAITLFVALLLFWIVGNPMAIAIWVIAVVVLEVSFWLVTIGSGIKKFATRLRNISKDKG